MKKIIKSKSLVVEKVSFLINDYSGIDYDIRDIRDCDDVGIKIRTLSLGRLSLT